MIYLHVWPAQYGGLYFYRSYVCDHVSDGDMITFSEPLHTHRIHGLSSTPLWASLARTNARGGIDDEITERKIVRDGRVPTFEIGGHLRPKHWIL